ncbi:restriction endonuclease [Pseudomonas sp. FIP_A4]|uniref:restriction endonuclease n=1 Tax=Pseudomonas sp. FIP_A4 TaxID=3070684 RepID=UPI002FD6D5CD
MALLDFKEIPEAHKGGGQQDTFELLARDFFEAMGYKIVRGPGRGADGGCDLIIEETRTGIAGTTNVKWLVSCKHKAHSGAAVLKTDEAEVKDSVESNGCQGFIGFYSTLPSSGLIQKVQSIFSIDHQFFDSARIEQILLSTKHGRKIAERYFQNSYALWTKEYPTKAQIFSDADGLRCVNCGDDITEGRKGIVVSWEKFRDNEAGQRERHVKHFYWCCRGECDRELKGKYGEAGYVDGWEDIHDLRIPTIYIRWVVGLLNHLYGGYRYSSEAFEAQKEMLLQLFPNVARNLTMGEVERINDLGAIPSFLGGLGYPDA